MTFFISYLGALRPTLGHWRGGSVARPMLITAHIWFDLKVTESTVKRYIDVLHFLWFRNINETPLTRTVLQFTRVVFGLTLSPFLLNQIIKYHLDIYQNQILRKLSKKYHWIYMTTTQQTNNFGNTQQAIEFYEKSKPCLKYTNLELWKWTTRAAHFRNSKFASFKHDFGFS